MNLVPRKRQMVANGCRDAAAYHNPGYKIPCATSGLSFSLSLATIPLLLHLDDARRCSNISWFRAEHLRRPDQPLRNLRNVRCVNALSWIILRNLTRSEFDRFICTVVLYSPICVLVCDHPIMKYREDPSSAIPSLKYQASQRTSIQDTSYIINHLLPCSHWGLDRPQR